MQSPAQYQEMLSKLDPTRYSPFLAPMDPGSQSLAQYQAVLSKHDPTSYSPFVGPTAPGSPRNHRTVGYMTLDDLPSATVSNEGVAEFYVPWDDFETKHAPSSAAAFISNRVQSNHHLSAYIVNNVIKRFVHAAHADDPGNEAQKAYAWLHIRVTKPTPKFDEPRWHQDGPYTTLATADRAGQERMKYCLTLLGPGTIFAERRPTDTDQFRQHRHDRSWLASELSGCDQYQGEVGEVVRCAWNITADDISGDLHTEPPHKVDRVFLALVFMGKEEIEDLTANRK